VKLTHNVGVRLLQILTHAVAIPVGVWAVMEGQWLWLLTAWLTYWVTGILGIDVGFHRFLAHGAFKTYRPIEAVLMFCGIVTTVGSPMAWTIVHRIHHIHTDDEHDPHSPQRIGVLRAWFGAWNTSGFKKAGQVSKRLRKDPFYKWTHKYYFHVIAVWNVALFATLGWQGVVFVYAIPAVLSLHSACGIIVIPHLHGYRTFDLKGDTSRNSWIANLITMGEGWHNNHHAHPSRWNTRVNWWEWDIPAQVIKLIHHRHHPLPRFKT